MLSCRCGKTFPLVHGIPRLLTEELRPDPAAPEALPLPPEAGAPAASDGVQRKACGAGKSCLVCHCHLGTFGQAELCRKCTAELLERGLDKKTLAGLYDALEQQAVSNTFTDYTISDLFVEWLAKNQSRDARILEIGCGGGYLCDTIWQQGFTDLIASDFNGRVVETAIERFPALQGVVMDSAQMAFAPESLDCVVSVEMVEHLLDPEQHFREVCRVLRPGGSYLLRTPNALAATLYYRWSGRYDMAIWHPSTFACNDLEKQLQRAGFEVDHLVPGSLPKSQVAKLPFLLKFLARVPLRWTPLVLRPSICVVARKR